MKDCSSCGATNRDTARFCIHCAAPILAEVCCGRCGIANPIQARFCMGCAAPLKVEAITGASSTVLTTTTVLAQRYQVLGKIGQGGMGAVYLVADQRLSDKHWALKELDPSALMNPQERQERIAAFQQEANLLASLAHPNLTKVLDCFSRSDRYYLVMDFVEGSSLRQLLDVRTTPFSEMQVLKWADQLCDVLSYLHTQSPPVIFRDLKPDNILVDQSDRIKLIDFGIARFFRPDRTKDTATFGTVGYAPPEQYGRGQTEARSDIYSLGATLHHLLTLRDPANDPFGFLPIRTIQPLLSPQLEQVVQRALEQRVEARWLSASAMKAALHATTPVTVTKQQSSSQSANKYSHQVAADAILLQDCPHCQERLTVGARYCPNCFKQVLQQPSVKTLPAATRLSSANVAPSKQTTPAVSPHPGTRSDSLLVRRCPRCDAPVPQSIRYCPVCSKSVTR